MTPYDLFWISAICGTWIAALVGLSAGRDAIERWRNR